jgi:hypothetical protein
MQWKPLNVITLGWMETDNNKRMITGFFYVHWKPLNGRRLLERRLFERRLLDRCLFEPMLVRINVF